MSQKTDRNLARTTSRYVWMAYLATVALVLIMGFAVFRESQRQNAAQDQVFSESIVRGMDVYALQCAECHGSHGQGNIQENATELDSDYMRAREDDYLYKVISRGRDNTEMAAFAHNEGGTLNRQNIDSLVTVIRHGVWDVTAARVAELGMVSPEERAILAAEQTPEVTDVMLDSPVPPSTLPLLNIQPIVTGEAGDKPGLPVFDIQPTVTTVESAVPQLPMIHIRPTATPEMVETPIIPALDIQPILPPDKSTMPNMPVLPIQPTASPNLPTINITLNPPG